jgi:hypothetical protein
MSTNPQSNKQHPKSEVAGSVSSFRQGPCYGSDNKAMGLALRPNRSTSWVVSYAHLLFAEMGPEPEVENDPAICPERITICFLRLDVVIVGSRLSPILELLQRAELGWIEAVAPDCAVPNQPYVQSIQVTLTRRFQ